MVSKWDEACSIFADHRDAARRAAGADPADLWCDEDEGEWVEEFLKAKAVDARHAVLRRWMSHLRRVHGAA